MPQGYPHTQLLPRTSGPPCEPAEEVQWPALPGCILVMCASSDWLMPLSRWLINIFNITLGLKSQVQGALVQD